MAVEKANIDQFLELAQVHPVLDVRSPSEYTHAHIPGAYALPLFTDEERKKVGTTYKQQSREDAIKVGLELFGPKMRKMVEEVDQLLGERSLTVATRAINKLTSNEKLVLVHCWRGGMRSAGVAWLLDLYGFKVFTLAGGYKAYRNYVRRAIEASYDFRILGGYTGSGKTILLRELQKHGEKIIDLEGLASHKGSAFGAIGLPTQPSQEMFENLLCRELISDSPKNKNGTGPSIWLEDESQRIGLINIPRMFWISMRRAPVYFVDVPFEERLQYVVKCYGNLDREKLINGIIRIKKRLGGLETKLAINFLLEENVPDCFRILLKYYDKYYLKGLNNRENTNQTTRTIVCDEVDAVSNAQKVLINLEAVRTKNTVNYE